jgi:hypothetical protein
MISISGCESSSASAEFSAIPAVNGFFFAGRSKPQTADWPTLAKKSFATLTFL